MTTTDRQLLTAAATAAGMTVLVEPWPNSPNGWFWCDHGNRGAGMYHAVNHAFWNPLVDDGDALRLAVVMGFINPGQWPCPGYGVAERMLQDGGSFDWYVATRRAIVVAAAAKVNARAVEVAS